MPHVLVIDEAPAILALLRELLEAEGLRVSTRAFPPPNLEQITDLHPSLIILDPFRPGQAAGRALLQTLRLDQDTCAIPIVLCTGTTRDVTMPGSRVAAMNVAVVAKPFDIDELLGVVADAICSRIVP